MPRSNNPLTPAQRSDAGPYRRQRPLGQRARPAGRDQAGRDAAFQKLLDEVDPEGVLSEAERLKRAKNLQAAQMARSGSWH